MNVTSRFDFSSVVVEREQTVTLMVRVKAPPAPPFTRRRPLNLSLVLDRSGSMDGDKIAYLRIAASQLVQNLTANDRLSVVMFDDVVETIVPPQAVTDKDRIRAAIETVFARGSTNLSGGWMAGLAHVEAGRLADGVNRVLLLTDGLANVGVVEPERLREIGAQHRARGIATTTLGFGADFNETLMASVADESGGTFYFIEDPDKAPAAFAEELGELLSVVGQNMSVEIHMQAPARLVAVLNKYPAAALPDGVQLRVGDLFGNEQREIFADVWIPALRELGPRRVGEIVVTLDQVVDPVQHHRIALPVEINVATPEQAPAAPDAEVGEAVMLLRINDIRDRVIQRLNEGDYVGARRVIDEAVAKLQAAGPLPPAVAAEVARLRAEVQATEDRPEYGSKPSFYSGYRQHRNRGDYRK